jgi:hypothetical protein
LSWPWDNDDVAVAAVDGLNDDYAVVVAAVVGF